MKRHWQQKWIENLQNIPPKTSQRCLCVNSLPNFVCKLRLHCALYCTVAPSAAAAAPSPSTSTPRSTPSSKLRDSVVKSTLFLSFKGHLIMHESFSTCLATARIYSLCELHMSCWIVKRNGRGGLNKDPSHPCIFKQVKQQRMRCCFTRGRRLQCAARNSPTSGRNH